MLGVEYYQNSAIFGRGEKEEIGSLLILELSDPFA